MTLKWNADRSALWYYPNSSSTNHGKLDGQADSAWIWCSTNLHSLLSSVTSPKRRCSLHHTANIPTLEMDLHDIFLNFSRTFDPAKTTGFVTLMGIGLGFGLTAYILYKISRKTERKPTDDSDNDQTVGKHAIASVSTTSTRKGLNTLMMGNGKSLNLVAGIKVDNDAAVVGDTPGVRHRNCLRKKLCASIVEDVSGAYISRAVVGNDGENLYAISVESSNVAQNVTELCNEQIPPAVETGASTVLHWSDNNVTTTVSPAMSDSGYLEADDHKRQKDTIVSDSFEQESSEISSLSDQQMRDLGCLDTTLSDFSSTGSSCHYQQDDVDEDVLRVEISGEDDEVENGQVLAIEEMLDSMLKIDPLDYSESSTDTTITTDTDSLRSHLPDHNYSSNTDLTDCQSTFSTPSPLMSARIEDESSRPSSLLSSPLFGAVSVSGHSRSSSITSADIDLEATSLDDTEMNSEIRSMEQELEEIRQEINHIEEKLDELKKVDTTKLYFNVDGMKKLTEVVLNSGEINLTSTEIAKAFQILRKYRYTFTSPVTKPMVVGHNEAESANIQSTPRKSLPYLDLADSCTPKPKQRRTAKCLETELCDQLPTYCIDEVISECNINEYSSCHPNSHVGYSRIAQDHGFTKMYTIEEARHAPLIAAYVGNILQAREREYEISIDYLYKALDRVLLSHSFLRDWNLGCVLSQTSADKLSTMKLCIKTCVEQCKKLQSIEDVDERANLAVQIFNHAPSTRALIVEGIRLQIFLKVNELYEQYVSGKDMPLHGWLLFNRETSTSPRRYFLNHIQDNSNTELTQMDLSLLADVLRINMRIFRPMDLETGTVADCYPKDETTPRPCISLAHHSASSYAILS